MSSTSETGEPQAPLVGPNDDSLESFWKSALLNYTSCNLTSQTDKTVAIWSIAKIVRDALNEKDPDEEYGGGMWRNGLHEQLAWRMKDSGVPGTRIPELQIKRPSWSWASVKGPVIASDRLCPPRCYTVTDHEGQPELLFEIEDYGDNRDGEPVLVTKPLAMAGFMGEGAIVHDHKAGTPRLEVSMSGNDQESIAPEDDQTGTFEIFLDESPAGDQPASKKQYSFIIVAATATDADGIYIQYPTTEGPGTEKEQTATYSGTALLLISHKEYASQQEAKFQASVKAVEQNPNAPDPPYGQGKSLVAQMKEMRELVDLLREREKRDGLGVDVNRWYRRVGAVQFRGVGGKRWESIMRKGRTKILLD